MPPVPDKVSTFNFGFIVLGGGLLMLSLSEIGIVGVGFGVILIIIQHFSIQSAKRKHNRELHTYTVAKRALEEYPGKLLRYQQDVVRQREPGYTEQYRREQVARVLGGSTTPTPMSAIQQLTIRKGSSEANFEPVLKRWLGASYVHSTVCLPIVYRSFEDNYYYPDFVYQHPSGLRIDIEIDEPYTGTGKAPIHYRGQDTQRNRYFTENGWVVVRFAEQQIVTQPELCCKLLAELISQLVPGQENFTTATGTLAPVPQWTFEQAKEMARGNIRTSYSSATF